MQAQGGTLQAILINQTPEINLLLVLWHLFMNVFEPLHGPHVSQGEIEEGMETQVTDSPLTLRFLMRLIYL